MATAKVRVGGAWVDSDLAGSVRVGGAWVPYGPGGGPALESLLWPAPPSGTDFVDPGETYNMGIRFSVAASRPCYGVEWRVPDSLSTPPLGTHVVSLWRNLTEVRLRFKDIAPTPGGTQQFLFDVPSDPLTVGEFYTVAVYTQHYVFRTGAGNLPVSSPSGNVVADEGRLIGSNAGPNVYPGPSFNAMYYIAPLVGV